MDALSTEHESVLGVLESLDIPYKVMGGYPRDLALGLGTPKDLDIAVYNCSNGKIGRLHALLKALGLVDMVHAEPPSLNADPRLKMVINTTVGADIICWGDDYTHWWDVCKGFDVNLNLFVLHHMATVHVGAGAGRKLYSPVFVGDNYGTLELISPLTVTELRLAKVQAKARDAGWIVDEDMYKQLPSYNNETAPAF